MHRIQSPLTLILAICILLALQGSSVLAAPAPGDVALPITLTNTLAVNPVDVWSLAAPMDSPRGMLTATELNNGKVLVVGGYPGDYGGLLNPQLYDSTSNTWSYAGKIDASSAFQTNFYYHTATLLKPGKV